MTARTPLPSIEELLEKVEGTSVEEMYRLPKDQHERAKRCNEHISKEPEDAERKP